MRRMPARHIAGTLLAAITGAVIGVTATHLGWLITLAVSAVLAVLTYLAVQAWRRATRRTGWIFRTELGDPDPFNERLRLEPRDDPTDTGDTQ